MSFFLIFEGCLLGAATFACGIVYGSDSVPARAVEILLAAGVGLLLVTSGFHEGKDDKTLPDLRGRCIARVDISQFPSNSTKDEVKKLTDALKKDVHCSGYVKAHVVKAAK